MRLPDASHVCTSIILKRTTQYLAVRLDGTALPNVLYSYLQCKERLKER